METEIFPREIGRKIGEAEEIRHASDYDDFYIASREESERQVEVADEFIQLVEKYCHMGENKNVCLSALVKLCTGFCGLRNLSLNRHGEPFVVVMLLCSANPLRETL